MPDCNTCENYKKKKEDLETVVKALLAEFKISYTNFSGGVEITNHVVFTLQLEALMATGAQVYYTSNGTLRIYGWGR